MKVSIVMPTYKRPHTILRAIATIKAQTHQDWELIIIDNAGDCIYKSDDPRIFVFTDNAVTSSAYARNPGIRRATGALLCNFDDDDEMRPNYLARFVETFKANPRANMVCCGMTLPSGRELHGYFTPTVCLRREYTTPTWSGDVYASDQRYYKSVIKAHGWSKSRRRGHIVLIPDILCHANTDPQGGIRAGNY